MKRQGLGWAFVILMSLCRASPAGDPDLCIQEVASTRLSTLRLISCLKADPGATDVPPIATLIVQTVENVSDRDIEVVIYDDPIYRSQFNIFRETELVSKRIVAPPVEVPNGLGALPPKKVPSKEVQMDAATLSVLKPMAKLRIEYRIDDLLAEPARKDANYTIAINTRIPYRFLDEPVGRAYQLRWEEETRKEAWLAPGWFRNVRLR